MLKEINGCDATRINPEFVKNVGRTFWNLQSYNDEFIILLRQFSKFISSIILLMILFWLRVYF